MAKRTAFAASVFLFSNIPLLGNLLRVPFVPKLLLIVLLSLLFLWYNILPWHGPGVPGRLAVLMGGRELLLCGLTVLGAEFVWYAFLCLAVSPRPGLPALLTNGAFCLLLLAVMGWNGVLRLVCTSTQLSLAARLLLLFLWWVPVFNLFLIRHSVRKALREYRFHEEREALHAVRMDSEICKTKYPLLLVHGIFWRDWQAFHYWGRIPKELTRNGARIYYGNHQSSAPMETGAAELRDQILRIVREEGCEKVNIIAHSKGGLDARWTVSRLGMAPYVASVTTVCAPHRGCAIIDRCLRRLPDSAVRAVARRYNALYKRLGDPDPDFYSGVRDLTTERCAAFNREAPDAPGVLYQSLSAKMSGFSSAGFPLNAGFALFPRAERDNDGFVSVESSKWGTDLGCAATKKRRGVSHGDMIDLTRGNIEGFNVLETYVELVKGLKEKGL